MTCRLTSLWAAGALVVLLAGCPRPRNGKPDGPQPRPATTQPEAVLKAADARLADAKFTTLVSFEGNKLYAYMDGAAETYYARGFLKLATVDVKWKETDAKVELYRVKTAANAAALLEEFDDGKGKKLAAGVRSAAWDAKELEGIFHRGPFFCRLIIYGGDKEAHQMLAALASAIDKAIAE